MPPQELLGKAEANLLGVWDDVCILPCTLRSGVGEL